jgi:DNA-binding NtrC family response regulator
VRVVAATNQDLWKMVKEGAFREDLYYRLDTVQIKLPPLRDRSEDIIPIFRKFVEEYSARYDSVFKGFSDEARELLISYRWPGNIRELRNVAEQLVVLEKSQFIDKEKLQKYLKGRQHEGSADNLPMVAGKKQGYNSSDSDDEFDRKDRELVYRALVELRNDIADVKKMFANFLYSSFTTKNLKALPASVRDEVDKTEVSGVNVNLGDHATLGMQSMPDDTDIEEPEDTELSDFLKDNEIPSIEEAEKFLIQQALKRFDGNRRKASETLGVSERTLYRKLDQYGLD